MRNAGRIGTVLVIALLVFVLAGVGLFRNLQRRPAEAADAGVRGDSLAAPLIASGTLDQQIAGLQGRLRTASGDWKGFAALGLDYVQQARVTFDPSYYPKAQGALQRSLALNTSDNYVAAVGMSSLAAARHDFTDALVWGEKARSINPYNAAVYGVIGDAQLELGRYDEAFASFQRMVDIRPDLSSWARVSYARELMGDVPGAITAMRQAKTYAGSPADAAWASYQLGELFFNSGDLGRAAAQYRNGARLSSVYVPNLAGLAKVAWAHGHPAEAIRDYTGVVARYPAPEYVIALGDLYRSTGRVALASQQDALLRAEETLLSANGVNLDLEQALFDASHGDASAGLAAAQEGWSRRHSVQVADALAWALYENGRYDEAARYSAIAMHLGTRSALFAFHAGMIQLQLGHRAAARGLLSSANDINPRFSIQYAPVLGDTLATLGVRT